MAKAVANINGLSRAMAREGTIQDGDMKDFALGFTQAKASFDFIDVGYGKERADSKIKGKNAELLMRPWASATLRLITMSSRIDAMESEEPQLQTGVPWRVPRFGLRAIP
jgi:hypothetical protein